MITEIRKDKVFIRRMNPQVRGMLEAMAPYASFPMRLIFANLWCFAPLLTALLPKLSAAAGGLLGTTCAFYNINTDEQNVCRAKTLLRCVDDQDLEKDMKALEAMADRFGVKLEKGEQPEAEA